MLYYLVTRVSDKFNIISINFHFVVNKEPGAREYYKETGKSNINVTRPGYRVTAINLQSIDGVALSSISVTEQAQLVTRAEQYLLPHSLLTVQNLW